MIRPPNETSRYSPSRVVLLAAAFLFLAPAYWLALQGPNPDAASRLRLTGSAAIWNSALQEGIVRLGHADVPHWSEASFAGTPFLADPLHGLFQPLNVVYALLPVGAASAWHASLCLFLTGFFFSLFLRSMGARYTSALGGGVAYACSGLTAGMLAYPQSLAALAWTPVVFWAVSEYGVSFQFRTAVLAGVAFAMLLLSGAVAIAAPMAALALAYGIVVVFFPILKEPPALGRRITGLGIIAGAGMGLPAFQWLPAMLWASTLSAPGATLTPAGLSGGLPRNAYEFLAQLVASTGVSASGVAYLGVAALPLLAAALFHVSRRLILFLAAVSLAAAGAVASGTDMARLALPVWTFGACALAGLGLDAVMSPGRDFRSPRIWGPLAVFLTATAAIALIGPAGAVGRLAFGLLIVLACAVLRSRWASPVFTVLYAALLILDLGAANSQWPSRASPRASSRIDAAAISLARELAAQGRILVADQDAASDAAGDGALLSLPVTASRFQRMPEEQAQSWAALSGKMHTNDAGPAIAEWANWPQPALLNHLAVRAVLTPSGIAPPPEWEKAGLSLRLHGTQGNADIYLNDAALPRAYWAPRWRHVPDAESARNALTDTAIASGAECAVEGAAPEAGAAVNRETLAMTPCTLEPVDSEHVRVLVDAPADGVVVLADVFAPGWHATVDGRPVEVLRANGLFRGVAVTKGPHLILFRYTTPGWYAGILISLATSLALFAGTLFQRSGQNPR